LRLIRDLGVAAWKRRVVHQRSVSVDPAYLIDREAMMCTLEHGASGRRR
jgi:hypothetical protein